MATVHSTSSSRTCVSKPVAPEKRVLASRPTGVSRVLPRHPDVWQPMGLYLQTRLRPASRSSQDAKRSASALQSRAVAAIRARRTCQPTTSLQARCPALRARDCTSTMPDVRASPERRNRIFAFRRQPWRVQTGQARAWHPTWTRSL